MKKQTVIGLGRARISPMTIWPVFLGLVCSCSTSHSAPAPRTGAAGVTIPAEKTWWRPLSAPSNASIDPGRCPGGVPDQWKVLKGALECVQDRSESFFAARQVTELWAGSPTWQRYVATVDVRIPPGRWLTLAAACARRGDTTNCGGKIQIHPVKNKPHKLITRVAGDGRWLRRPEVSDMGRRRVSRDRPYFFKADLKSWIKPRRMVGARGQSRMEGWRREHSQIPSLQERWLRLRIEVTRAQLRLWLDGQLLASIEQPGRSNGGVWLRLPSGSRLRRTRVDALPTAVEGFLPLDLTPRFNGLAIGGALGDGHAFSHQRVPPAETFIMVQGVPFFWTSAPGRANSLDISRTRFRGLRPYIFTSAHRPDVRRIILRVPKRQYRALVVIGAADTDPRSTNVLNVRMFKAGRGMVVDSTQPIPKWDASPTSAAAALPAGLMLRGQAPSSRPGRLWLVKVPLNPGAFQDFLASPTEHYLELDLTGPPLRPGEPPLRNQRVGVHLLAATLVESPVEMTVTSGEAGHVFVEPQIPTMKITLRNTTAGPLAGSIEARNTDFYHRTTSSKLGYQLGPWERKALSLPLPVSRRGLHHLDVHLLDARERLLVRRRTTLATLARTERRAELSSPFGMWAFTGAHFGAGEAKAGELMRKIGVRWAHGVPALSPAFTRRFGIRPAYGKDLSRIQTAEERQQILKSGKSIIHWPLFQEQALSDKHYNYFPPELLERPGPRPLTNQEEQTLKERWRVALERSRLVRKFPSKKIVFGAGYPHFIATFLSRGWPRKYIDSLALDFVGDKMQFFYYLRQVARHYGYQNVPLQIIEGFYVGSGHGYTANPVRERRQSDIYIQGFLRGLGLGVIRFGGSPGLWDPGSVFHWTSYGDVGICHMAPELNPKPAYVAYGTMTGMLDRARFHSMVPTGSNVTYALRFNREGSPGKSRGPVYALWTVRGRRKVEFTAASGLVPRLTDSQGNSRPLRVHRGRASLELGTEPLWLEQAGEVHLFQSGPAVHDARPLAQARTIASFADPSGWRVARQKIDEMQALDDSIPVATAMFRIGPGEGPHPGSRGLVVKLDDDPRLSPHRLRYGRLIPRAPIVIPRGSAAVGLWVHGNSAASVNLEVVDASGRRFTTIPSRPRHSFGMDYRGPQAFDGWRYISFSLRRSEDRDHPGPCWLSQGNQGSPRLPAKLTGIVLQQYAKVIYLDTLAAPTSRTWRLGGSLLAEMAPPAAPASL